MLNEDGEETIHSNVIELKTNRDKRRNWWYYNRKKVLIGFLLLVTVIYFIATVFFKTKPDYTIALVNQISLGDEVLDILEAQIAKYGEDLNGDGQVIVEVMNYSANDEMEKNSYYAQSLQATYVKMGADITLGDSMIWLHDEAGYELLENQVAEGLFKPLDLENTVEGDDTMIDIENVPGLYATDYSTYEGEVFTGDDVKKLMDRLRVSIREPEGSTIEKDEELMEYYEASEKLFYNLVNDIQTNSSQQQDTETAEG